MIDSHCHLADDAFAGDLDDVIARARAAGLDGACCILSATDDAECVRAATIRAKWNGVRFAIGVHPHRAGEFVGRIDAAADCVRDRFGQVERATAVGEIGLDYHYDFAPKAVQRDVFAAQVALARTLARPIVIHTREAAADTIEILTKEGQGDVRGVFHCFSGDRALAGQALELGFHVSFSGMVTFQRADNVREAARIVPLDRLLAETDSPYLAPVPYRGKRNEPAWVVSVVAALADLHGVPVEVMEHTVSANFDTLFGWPADAKNST